MARHRPTAILVIAILHIIGASIGILSSCYSVAMMGVAQASSTAPSPAFTPPPGAPQGQPTPPNAAQILKYYEEHVPGYTAFTFGSLAVSFLLDVMLLASGIGLLKMQPWARLLSLIYAPLSILFHILSFGYQLIVVLPASHDLFAQMAGLGPMGTIMEAAATIGAVVSFLIVVYPIVVLVIMLRHPPWPLSAMTFPRRKRRIDLRTIPGESRRGAMPSRADSYPLCQPLADRFSS